MRAPRPVFPAMLAAALLFAFTAPVEAGGVNMGTLRPLVLAILDSLGITSGGVYTAPDGSGDITAVVAGDGLTDGGTTGSVTLNVAVGTGLTAAADEITLDEELVDVAGVTPTADQFLGGTGSALAMRTASQVRASLVLATTDDVTFDDVTGTGHNLAQTYGGEIAAVDASLALADGAVQTITLSTATEFTGPTGGSATHSRAMRVLITGDDADTCNLTFPAEWRWIGTKPASIAANAVAFLYLTVDGTGAGDVTACYVLTGNGA